MNGFEPCYARVVGTGSALPARCVDNEALCAELASRGIESSATWIQERTGILQRYVAGDGESSAVLGARAAQSALAMAQLTASEVDLIIVATSTPDYVFPSTACLIQRALGNTGAAAFDVQAVCSGFVYALTVADAMIRARSARCALVVGAEVFSRLLDWQDRSTCVLFGDGAGAVVLQASTSPGILAARVHADGRHEGVLRTACNMAGGQISGHPFLTMDGQAVFKLAVNVLDEVAREVLRVAQVSVRDLDWLIPHQANARILAALARKLDLPTERVIKTVDQHANTSAASVPLAFDCAVRDGRIQRGQRLLLQGVGGGFTWGAVALQF